MFKEENVWQIYTMEIGLHVGHEIIAWMNGTQCHPNLFVEDKLSSK